MDIVLYFLNMLIQVVYVSNKKVFFIESPYLSLFEVFLLMRTYMIRNLPKLLTILNIFVLTGLRYNTIAGGLIGRTEMVCTY